LATVAVMQFYRRCWVCCESCCLTYARVLLRKKKNFRVFSINGDVFRVCESCP